jgi:hypothetical protein
MQAVAYVEVPETRSQPFWERHGFRSIGSSFSLPNGATFHPMQRTPKTGPSDSVAWPAAGAGRDREPR